MRFNPVVPRRAPDLALPGLCSFQLMIAHDKGKLAVKRGRKAVSLDPLNSWSEIVWLPKAIEGTRKRFDSRFSVTGLCSVPSHLTPRSHFRFWNHLPLTRVIPHFVHLPS